jgi:hypothetical protein
MHASQVTNRPLKDVNARADHSWAASSASIAATKTPESTMMLRAETLANALTVRFLFLPQPNRTKDILQAGKRVAIFARQFKDVSAIVGLDDHALAAIRRFACLTKGSLEICEVRFHADPIV